MKVYVHKWTWVPDGDRHQTTVDRFVLEDSDRLGFELRKILGGEPTRTNRIRTRDENRRLVAAWRDKPDGSLDTYVEASPDEGQLYMEMYPQLWKAKTGDRYVRGTGWDEPQG